MRNHTLKTTLGQNTILGYVDIINIKPFVLFCWLESNIRNEAIYFTIVFPASVLGALLNLKANEQNLIVPYLYFVLKDIVSNNTAHDTV